MKRPSNLLVMISIILIVINFYISYTVSGKSISYVVGNVFGFPMIVIMISSIFKQYRNSNSRWIILLNIMVITLMLNVVNMSIAN